MSLKCQKCSATAVYEIKVTLSGPVASRYETRYACEGCKEAIAKIRSSSADFKRI